MISAFAGSLRLFNPLIQYGHHLVAFADRERATGTEIVLYIDHQQRIAGLHSFILRSF